MQTKHRQLKLHFDTPGAPKYESLGQLAQGMNASRAAKFFYQTCGNFLPPPLSLCTYLSNM